MKVCADVLAGRDVLHVFRLSSVVIGMAPISGRLQSNRRGRRRRRSC
jgi:hypothetical protein